MSPVETSQEPPDAKQTPSPSDTVRIVPEKIVNTLDATAGPSIDANSQEKLRAVLEQALTSCQRLEADPSLAGNLTFRGDEVMVLVNDRLRAPNTAETLEELQADLRAIGAQLFGSTELALQHMDNPDDRFSVRLESPVELKIDELLANVRS